MKLSLNLPTTEKPVSLRILMLLLAAINFMHIVDFMLVMPLGPFLIKHFNITNLQFTLIVSSYNIAAGVFGVLGAFFLDRFDRKTALLTLFVGFTLGTLACGIAPSFILLVVARTIAGAFGGMIGGLLFAIIGDMFPPDKRGEANGVLMTAFSVASIFGVPIGLKLADLFNWHVPFLVLGSLSVLLGIIMFLFIPSMKNHIERAKQNSIFKSFKEMFFQRNTIIALSFTISLVFGHFMVIPLLSTYTVLNMKISESDLMYIYVVGGGFTFFTNPLIGKLADRKGHFKIFMLFALLCIIPLILVTHAGEISLLAMLVIAALFFVFSGGRFGPAMAIITSSVKPHQRGSFMSLNTATMNVFMGLAATVSGYITGEALRPDGTSMMTNYDITGYVAVGFTILSLYIGSKIKRVS